MGSGYHGGFGNTEGAKRQLSREERALVAELKKNDVKFTEKDIVFITRDKTGQIVWLEKGNTSAGLKHLLDGGEKSKGHTADFKRAFGISRSKIPSFLKKVVSKGEIVSNRLKAVKGRDGFERVYRYKGRHYVLVGVGTNGFITTAYPTDP